MSDKSAIEWTDATWNPVTGCTKVSPGCARCYIDRSPPFRIAGRKFVKGATGLVFHPERLDQPLRWTRPRMIFVNSLSDMFHEDIPVEFTDSVFETMEAATQHIFQVLTKRPERMRDYVLSRGAAPAHVWLGTTIENARFAYRADVLRDTPAIVRFISAEPLLGSLFTAKHSLDLDSISWVIAGGESGPGYRPVNVEHVREIRDACAANSVAFFFKQWGGRTAKAGGKVLDGREWCELPRVA